MNPVILLDLDGTLVDSVPDLHAALDRMLLPRGLAPLSRAEATAMIGDGVRVLVERALAARGAVADEAAIAGFLADYEAHASEETRLFPGIAAALAEMVERGWRLAVCTNKPERPARAILEGFGIGHLFAAIGGGDSFPVRKPDPAHVLATLAAAGGGTAVMVGDHANDMLAGSGAGLPVLFCGWGYGTAAMAGAAPVAAMVSDLVPLLARLLGGASLRTR